jgi:hypothetical protein
MWRRVLLILGALGLLAVVGVLVLVWLPRPGDRITRETFEQIRDGMTLDEVEAIIGAPPGEYTTTDVIYSEFLGSTIILRGSRDMPAWEGYQGKIVVFLDAERKVYCRYFFDPICRESFFDRLRRRIGF